MLNITFFPPNLNALVEVRWIEATHERMMRSRKKKCSSSALSLHGQVQRFSLSIFDVELPFSVRATSTKIACIYQTVPVYRRLCLNDECNGREEAVYMKFSIFFPPLSIQSQKCVCIVDGVHKENSAHPLWQQRIRIYIYIVDVEWVFTIWYAFHSFSWGWNCFHINASWTVDRNAWQPITTFSRLLLFFHLFCFFGCFNWIIEEYWNAYYVRIHFHILIATYTHGRPNAMMIKHKCVFVLPIFFFSFSLLFL